MLKEVRTNRGRQSVSVHNTSAGGANNVSVVEVRCQEQKDSSDYDHCSKYGDDRNGCSRGTHGHGRVLGIKTHDYFLRNKVK